MLLANAENWADKHADLKIRQTDMEFCMLLRLLLGCGFRLGEPLSARVKDVNFSRMTILIRHAKNGRQRIVPMDAALTTMLEKYCIAMAIKTEPINRPSKIFLLLCLLLFWQLPFLHQRPPCKMTEI